MQAVRRAERKEPMETESLTIEGRNAVIEAYRSGRTIDKLYILENCHDGPVMTVKREAKKQNTPVKYVTKERLDQLSQTGKHQGVIACAAAYAYAEVEEILSLANRRLSSCWITLRIRTIWAPLSGRPIWRGPMV